MKFLTVLSLIPVALHLVIPGSARAQAERGFTPFAVQSAFVRCMTTCYTAIEKWPDSNAVRIELRVEEIQPFYQIRLDTETVPALPDHTVVGLVAEKIGAPRLLIGSLLGDDASQYPVVISPGSELTVLIADQGGSAHIETTVKTGQTIFSATRDVPIKSRLAGARVYAFGVKGSFSIVYGKMSPN